jgi:hypothetical protein
VNQALRMTSDAVCRSPLTTVRAIVGGAFPRRSTSSLAVIRASALYSANQPLEAHLWSEECLKSNRKFALFLM